MSEDGRGRGLEALLGLDGLAAANIIYIYIYIYIYITCILQVFLGLDGLADAFATANHLHVTPLISY